MVLDVDEDSVDAIDAVDAIVSNVAIDTMVPMVY